MERMLRPPILFLDGYVAAVHRGMQGNRSSLLTTSPFTSLSNDAVFSDHGCNTDRCVSMLAVIALGATHLPMPLTMHTSSTQHTSPGKREQAMTTYDHREIHSTGY
jgi:hypothetical protein